jgi:hypothetical protein
MKTITKNENQRDSTRNAPTKDSVGYCNLTVVNPTKDSFDTGENINQACRVDVDLVGYENIGSGTVVTYIPNSLIANGTYSSLGETGTWNISLTQNTDGTWVVVVAFTGKASKYNQSFTANGSVTSASTPTLTFADIASENTVVISQDNGSILTDGRIKFNANWTPASIYLDSNTK